MGLSNENARELLEKLATESGFEKIGFVDDLKIPASVSETVEKWVRDGRAAQMHWFSNTLPVRLDVKRFFQPAKSAIVLLHSYYHPSKNKWQKKSPIKIAHYAAGKDYHKVLRKKIHTIMKRFGEHAGGVQYRIAVDSAPVLERYFATKAGLGWIGKNSMHISPSMGSYHFIAVVFTDVMFKSSGIPVPDYCGSCTKCLDSCPTKAIMPGRVVDSRRCISYLNIEHDGSIDDSLKPFITPWVFGCDECIQVCPWNSKKAITVEQKFENHLNDVEIKNLLNDYYETKFNEVFAGMPIRRAGAGHFRYLLDLCRTGDKK